MIEIIWGAASVETQASVSDSFHWWYERIFVLVTHLQLLSCSEGFRCGDVLCPWRKQKLHLALSMNSSAGPFENIALICNIWTSGESWSPPTTVWGARERVWRRTNFVRSMFTFTTLRYQVFFKTMVNMIKIKPHSTYSHAWSLAPVTKAFLILICACVPMFEFVYTQ